MASPEGAVKAGSMVRNVLANFAGQGWSTIVALVVVPFYIRLMGIEAYGLVGFYVTLQTAISLLDFGLSTTINRELARSRVAGPTAPEPHDLVRTLEAAYWVIGLLVGVALVGAAGVIATSWLNPQALTAETVRRGVALMGIAIAVQAPRAFYTGALYGLERHVLLNGVNIAASTARSLGALAVLYLISPTVIAFFAWQILVGAAHVALLAAGVWRSLPAPSRAPRVRPRLVLDVWRFAAGVSATAALGLALRQVDKVVLSKLLSLELLGYYMLASMIANALGLLASPFFTGIFPRLAAYAAAGDRARVRDLYHRGSQFVAATVIPASVIVGLFSYELLLLWTGNPSTARLTAPIASLLVAGTALNSVVGLAYELQVAHGWTRLGVYKNALAAAVLVPLLVFLTRRYGPAGAAMVWVLLNVGYLLVELPIMHRRLLPGELWRWYVQVILRPATAALAIALLLRVLLPAGLGWLALAAILGLGSIVVYLGALSAMPHVRGWALERLGGLRPARAGSPVS